MIDDPIPMTAVNVRFAWHDQYKGIAGSCLFASGIFAGHIEAYSWPDRPDKHYIAWVHNNTGTGTCAGIYTTIKQAREGLRMDVERLFRGAANGK